MNIILFSFLASAYIFSGLICLVAYLRHFNQPSSLSEWQHLQYVLTNSLIMVFWPIWIITQVSGNLDSKPEWCRSAESYGYLLMCWIELIDNTIGVTIIIYSTSIVRQCQKKKGCKFVCRAGSLQLGFVLGNGSFPAACWCWLAC